ncbi:hypothetical protein [Pseudophaeobacter sp.]|uniref:hypothetical protein n=1 Tax=Pseudophaeobacter sp. TaxID=1971739 RepID=UPI00329819A7
MNVGFVNPCLKPRDRLGLEAGVGPNCSLVLGGIEGYAQRYGADPLQNAFKRPLKTSPAGLFKRFEQPSERV